MNLLVISNIVLVLGALTGMYCIAHHQKKGFIIFLGVEASMSYIGYSTGNYGLVVAAVLYLIMNVYSYLKWTQAENRPKGNARKIQEAPQVGSIDREDIKRAVKAVKYGRVI